MVFLFIENVNFDLWVIRMLLFMNANIGIWVNNFFIVGKEIFKENIWHPNV